MLNSSITVDLAQQSSSGGAGIDYIYGFENIIIWNSASCLIGDTSNNTIIDGALVTIRYWEVMVQ